MLVPADHRLRALQASGMTRPLRMRGQVDPVWFFNWWPAAMRRLEKNMREGLGSRGPTAKGHVGVLEQSLLRTGGGRPLVGNSAPIQVDGAIANVKEWERNVSTLLPYQLGRRLAT